MPCMQVIFWADPDAYTCGDENAFTCASTTPAGYATDFSDCYDPNPCEYPCAEEVTNSIDNNCHDMVQENASGSDLAHASLCIFPNPATDGVCTPSRQPHRGV